MTVPYPLAASFQQPCLPPCLSQPRCLLLPPFFLPAYVEAPILPQSRDVGASEESRARRGGYVLFLAPSTNAGGESAASGERASEARLIAGGTGNGAERRHKTSACSRPSHPVKRPASAGTRQYPVPSPVPKASIPPPSAKISPVFFPPAPPWSSSVPPRARHTVLSSQSSPNWP